MKSEAYAVEQYICDLCLSVWDRYDKYKSEAANSIDFDTNKLKLVLKCYFEISEVDNVKRKEEGHRFMLKKYQELLENLPLGDYTAKVGIYGNGAHTRGLLNAYNTLVGDVCSQLVFFETVIKDDNREESHGCTIKGYLEIDDTYDLIILSSFIYQSEMKKNVLAINKDCPLLCFYGDDLRADIFTGVNGLL